MIRFLTAGESHGKCLLGFLEGLPAGLSIDTDFINLQLHHRQLGYGRGGRMKIETDQIEILSGVRHGMTLGSPISFMISNKDWNNWRLPMSIEPIDDCPDIRSIIRPRPGHADLAGALKYQTHDIRDILERASARESASRVAGGAICMLLLSHFGVRIGSHVIAVGRERIAREYEALSIEKILTLDWGSPLHCADPDAEKRMVSLIDEFRGDGDTLGGIVEVVASPIPPGMGSHIQWDRRLDGLIAQAMMSIPSVKGVEIGNGMDGAQIPGSGFHDPIYYNEEAKRFFHISNRAGGIEGGISNGEDIRVRIYLKPIPTLNRPLPSVDIRSKEAFEAVVERSDTCAVPAAGAIAEAMLSLVLAQVFVEKFGGDSVREVSGNYANYCQLLENY